MYVQSMVVLQLKKAIKPKRFNVILLCFVSIYFVEISSSWVIVYIFIYFHYYLSPVHTPDPRTYLDVPESFVSASFSSPHILMQPSTQM